MTSPDDLIRLFRTHFQPDGNDFLQRRHNGFNLLFVKIKNIFMQFEFFFFQRSLPVCLTQQTLEILVG